MFCLRVCGSSHLRERERLVEARWSIYLVLHFETLLPAASRGGGVFALTQTSDATLASSDDLTDSSGPTDSGNICVAVFGFRGKFHLTNWQRHIVFVAVFCSEGSFTSDGYYDSRSWRH